MKIHIPTAAASASANPQWRRMPGMKRGTPVCAAKFMVCGKLKPPGSFQGPKTSQERKRSAT